MNKKKSYYVATSIPYVNAVPHIGHAWEFIIADVLTRYYKQQDFDVFFSTGTDEHGGKIQEAAQEQGVTPKQLVDKNALAFKDLGSLLNIEYTKFIRTTSKEHESRAQLIWKNLGEYIYKGSYVGMYDTREETFITLEQAKVIKEDDPKRYERLKRIEEDNYFFKLSEFTDKLKKEIKSGRLNIVPKTKRNEVLGLLNDGLDDISVSRPEEKIPWGIGVPGDDTQTIYVWFEALMNYVTTLGYPDGEDFKKFWPGNHVIGKDIIRFHAVIWPAMLMVLDEKIPHDIYVHGFINLGDEKMSKSLGNVVSPLELVLKYGSDATRYYFMRHVPSYGDGEFTWEKMDRAYHSELANDLGNLVQRVQTMITKFGDGRVGKAPEASHDEGSYHESMSNYKFDRALEFCWELVRGLNQYVDEEKPWVLAKEPAEADHLEEVLAYLAKSLQQLSVLLAPFLPETAEKISSVFSSKTINPLEVTLFPKIEDEDSK